MELKPILIGAGLAIVLGVGGTVGYVKYKEFKEAETEVEPDYSLKPYTGELQNETFYIKSGNDFYASYIGNTNITNEEAIVSSVNTERYITYADDESKIPVLYKDDELIYKGNTGLGDFTWERFKDSGWTVGISSIQVNEDGRLIYDQKNTKVNMLSDVVNGLSQIQLPEGITSVVIDEINGVKADDDMLTEAGTIKGFERNDEVTLEMYVGTTPYEVKSIADTHYLTPMEIYNTKEYDLNPEGYAVVTVPDYMFSGYYLINGKMFVKYINRNREEGMEGVDLSVPYYYTENGRTYTYEEYKELKGEDIEIKEEPDFSYSFIQEEGKKTTVKVSYLSNNDGTGTFMKQEAKVLSPSGEIKELKIEKVKGKYTFALETTEEPGDWKIETYNTDGENIEVEVSEKNIEIIEETQEETEAIS